MYSKAMLRRFHALRTGTCSILPRI